MPANPRISAHDLSDRPAARGPDGIRMVRSIDRGRPAAGASRFRAAAVRMLAVLGVHVALLAALLQLSPELRKQVEPVLVSIVTPPRPEVVTPPKPLAPPPPAPPPREVRRAPATPRETAPEPPARSAEPAPNAIAVESAPPPPAAAAAAAVPAGDPDGRPVPPAPKPAPAVLPPRFDAAYLNNPRPEYPRVSKRMGEHGKVMLRVYVSASGAPEKVEVRTSSGSPRLDQAARQAVEQWKFVPARQGDEPVAAWVIVPITFVLEG